MFEDEHGVTHLHTNVVPRFFFSSLLFLQVVELRYNVDSARMEKKCRDSRADTYAKSVVNGPRRNSRATEKCNKLSFSCGQVFFRYHTKRLPFLKICYSTAIEREIRVVQPLTFNVSFFTVLLIFEVKIQPQLK